MRAWKRVGACERADPCREARSRALAYRDQAVPQAGVLQAEVVPKLPVQPVVQQHKLRALSPPAPPGPLLTRAHENIPRVGVAVHEAGGGGEERGRGRASSTPHTDAPVTEDHAGEGLAELA